MHYKLGLSTHLKYRKFSSFNREMKYEKQVIVKNIMDKQAIMQHLLATTFTQRTLSIGFEPTAVQTWME